MTSTPTTAATGAAAIAVAALDWYAANGRDLAFRRSVDPWAVLVSEVMAQQTQAERAAEAWSTFIDRYPTPAALARESVAEVIRAWRGLGYNRRAVALRAAAVRMLEDHGGAVPDTVEALEALPGIGPYTARAVLAIAFGRPVAALDTNIRRVLDRAVGPLPTGAKLLQSAADRVVPPGHAAAWTHALMDIGAAFCRTRDPRCAACPLASHCAFVAMRGQEAGAGGPSAASLVGSRTASPTRSAPPFESTNRWLRGRILDRLRDAPPTDWVSFEGPLGGHDLDAIDRALVTMEAEGLLERDRDRQDLRRARLVTAP
jgi:A/G-specific adenine glycosylase